MAKPNAADSTSRDIFTIKRRPAAAHLRTNVPAERRDLAARAALLQRIRAEYEELQGMRVTSAQAARLFGISREAGSRILDGMVAAELLNVTGDQQYVLRAKA